MPFSFAKDKGYYLPLAGYTSTWDDTPSKTLHGGRFGILGYSFSEDFRLELTGLGYGEKITQLIVEPINIKNPESSPCTPSNRSRKSSLVKVSTPYPSNSLHQQAVQDELGVLKNMVESVSSRQLSEPLRECDIDGLQENLESLRNHLNSTALLDEGNPWKADGVKTPRRSETTLPIESSDTNSINPTTLVESCSPDEANQSNPQLDTTTLDTAKTNKTTQTIWAGASLAGKWTFLHLHPKCRIYWGPGVTFLCPNEKNLSANCFLTLIVGLHWVINPKFSIDCSRTKMLKFLGSKTKTDTLFSQKKLNSFTVGLNWHF